MLPKNKDFVFFFAQGLIYIRQRLYREIGAPLKQSHVYYNLTSYALHTNRSPLYDDELPTSRTKDKLEDRQGAVYKIKSYNCQATYIGKTDRNLSTRPTEHKRATRNGDVNNYIAKHHLQTKHQINLYYVPYILLSTTHFRRLVYKLRANPTES